MAAHDVGSGSHEEVQHLSRKHRNVRVLPVKRVDKQHEALSHQRELGPIRAQKHNPLLRQDTADHLQTHAKLLANADICKHILSFSYFGSYYHQYFKVKQQSSMHIEYFTRIIFAP